MEEIDLSRGQSGILKLAGRARIAPLKVVFGVEIVDGKDESKEDKKKSDVEVLSVSPGNRIPWRLIYEKREVKVKFKTGPRVPRKLKIQAFRSL